MPTLDCSLSRTFESLAASTISMAKTKTTRGSSDSNNHVLLLLMPFEEPIEIEVSETRTHVGFYGKSHIWPTSSIRPCHLRKSRIYLPSPSETFECWENCRSSTLNLNHTLEFILQMPQKSIIITSFSPTKPEKSPLPSHTHKLIIWQIFNTHVKRNN